MVLHLLIVLVECRFGVKQAGWLPQAAAVIYRRNPEECQLLVEQCIGVAVLRTGPGPFEGCHIDFVEGPYSAAYCTQIVSRQGRRTAWELPIAVAVQVVGE